MSIRLSMPAEEYQQLIAHLLPNGNSCEQASFMFAEADYKKDEAIFNVIETRNLTRNDFAIQRGDFLELNDTARAQVIKRAHDLDASLIEIHSHVGPWAAAFSIADRCGLRETLPHMWWRLHKKPYLALVVTQNEFDALIWLDNPTVPVPLDAWDLGKRTIYPSNNSLGGWQ